MANNKKYYYLKVKDNFYDSDTMIILESMDNGYLYSNILMKMYLRSLKTDGRLMFNERIPYNTRMLAQIVRHNPDVVEKAVNIFKELELIEVLDNGAIYMSDIQNYIGESSTEADRKREYRTKIKSEKQLLLGQMSDQMSGQIADKNPPEIEIEKELELELEKEKEIKIEKEILYPAVQDNMPYKEVIDYLNFKLGTNYKSTTKKTKDCIKARFNEGYTVDDFKIVIDKKYNEWSGTEMEKYLRPETLFGNKFEGYLNQKEKENILTFKDAANMMNWEDFYADK